MAAYYNESNPHAAAWLRNLAAGGLICPGDVAKLRAYGNAISPQIAAEVIRTFMEIERPRYNEPIPKINGRPRLDTEGARMKMLWHR